MVGDFLFILFFGLWTLPLNLGPRARKTSSQNTLEDVRNGGQAVSGSLSLLPQIPKKALHCSIYIPSSSDQGLNVLSGIYETHFSELSKLCCI